MAYFVGTAMGFSGSQRAAPFGNCSNCGERQHLDTSGQYVVGCPFLAGTGGQRRGTQATQVVNVVNGRNGGRSTQVTQVFNGGNGGRNTQVANVIIGGNGMLTNNSSNRRVIRSSAINSGANVTSRQTRKMSSQSSGFVTPPRNTRSASTNAPIGRTSLVSAGNNGINVIQIQQIQNSSRSGGGTGQLAIGGGGGYGIRRKVTTPNYLPQAKPTQRVNPSGYLYF